MCFHYPAKVRHVKSIRNYVQLLKGCIVSRYKTEIAVWLITLVKSQRLQIYSSCKYKQSAAPCLFAHMQLMIGCFQCLRTWFTVNAYNNIFKCIVNIFIAFLKQKWTTNNSNNYYYYYMVILIYNYFFVKLFSPANKQSKPFMIHNCNLSQKKEMQLYIQCIGECWVRRKSSAILIFGHFGMCFGDTWISCSLFIFILVWIKH